MNSRRTSLLVVTPLILTAAAVNVSAQSIDGAKSAISAEASIFQASLTGADVSGAVGELSVPAGATYAFTAPAGLAVTVRVGDTEVLSTDGSATGPQRGFTTLTAGTYTISVYGDDLTAEQVSSITAGVVGMTASSITSTSATSSASSIAGAETATTQTVDDTATETAMASVSEQARSAVRSVPLSVSSTANETRNSGGGSIRETIRSALMDAVAEANAGGETPVTTPPVTTPPVT
ncbi:MAG: hypothetical protein AAFQ09_09940, partial [Pseudomonadota bacterium]